VEINVTDDLVRLKDPRAMHVVKVRRLCLWISQSVLRNPSTHAVAPVKAGVQY